MPTALVEYSLLNSINFRESVSLHTYSRTRFLRGADAVPCFLKKVGHTKIVFEPFLPPPFVLYPCQTAASVLPLHEYYVSVTTLLESQTGGNSKLGRLPYTAILPEFIQVHSTAATDKREVVTI